MVDLPHVPTLDTMTYVGIDPGQSGGICIMETENGKICGIDIHHMPQTEYDLWDFFANELDSSAVAIVEVVHAYPKQGVSSAFTFGRWYGAVRMACTGQGITMYEIRPEVWQKALGIPPRKKKKEGKQGETKEKHKEKLRAVAQRMFPALPVWKGLKKVQLAICDALLLAEFLRRREEGKL